ncbi:MAG: hypothetical protein K8S55_03745, partial [Phycisphaerae bacterium]|nr:hypothetical protein [Phycisphaerae bacterium]
ATAGLTPREVEQLGLSLEDVGGGRLVAFDHPKHLTANIPIGNVDLVVLGGFVSPEASRRMLKWIRRHWHGCMCLMVGSDAADEQVARESGAMFLLRPVTGDVWDGVLDGALQCQAAKLTSA